MSDDRKAIHAYLTVESHDVWHEVSEEAGVSLSGFLEALAADMKEHPPEAGGHPRWTDIIKSARKMGIKDPRKKYEIADMVKGDCLFAATGVTSGAMLSGVKFGKDVIETETVVMRSVTGTVRRVMAEHRQFEKFHLD